jgi:protein-tyrosine-phosphatase
MRIHFICTGNIYRSRLAEAYCTYRCSPGIHVFSSGIAAGKNGDALISPYAAEVLNQFDLGPFASAKWQRTTEELVRASDVLVFMESEHRRFCKDWIEPARQRVEVWEVEDIGPIPEAEIAEKVQETFEVIRQRTDTLLAALGLAGG